MRYDERKEAEAYERGLNIGRLEAAKDLAAAEERGRRRGVEERDELQTLLQTLRPLIRDEVRGFSGRKQHGWEKILARIDAALAPRDSATADDGYCKTCNSINGTHQSWCTSFKAPRDSVATCPRCDQQVSVNGGTFAMHYGTTPNNSTGCDGSGERVAPRDSATIPAGDWRKERDAADDRLIAELKAPRDSAPVCDCDSPLFQGSHLASCPKMQPRDSGKEGQR